MSETTVAAPPLAEILADLTVFVRSYTVAENEQLVAIALWVAHTHVFAASEVTPYLAITSPEKRCGKSSLRNTLAVVVANPKKTGGMSPAVLYRLIEQAKPTVTVLFDEIDGLFGTKNRDERNDDLAQLLKLGYHRGEVVQRMGGKNFTEIQDFEVYSPKCFSGIGLHTLPDTIRDRSIEIRLRRKKRAEVVKRQRLRLLEPAGQPLKERLEAWAAEAVDLLFDVELDLPDELNDRAQDIWEPLLAIADLAGGQWPRQARLAAIQLSGGDDPDDDSFGVRLLSAIRDIWVRRDGLENAERDRIKTTDLIWELSRDIEAPFAEWWDERGEGKPAPGVAKRLSHRLREYEIRSETIRFQDGAQRKGYRREHFAGAFERYLPDAEAADEAGEEANGTDWYGKVPYHDSSRNGATPVVERDATGVTDGTRFSAYPGSGES